MSLTGVRSTASQKTVNVGGKEVAGANKGYAMSTTNVPNHGDIKYGTVFFDNNADTTSMGAVLTASSGSQIYITGLTANFDAVDVKTNSLYIGFDTSSARATASYNDIYSITVRATGSADCNLTFDPPLASPAADYHLYAYLGLGATNSNAAASTASAIVSVIANGFEV